MAKYIEYIKLANDEPWAIRDVEAHQAIEDVRQYTDERVADTINRVPTRWQNLWTNPDPTTPMQEGTFATGVDLGSYDTYLIVCRHTTGFGYENSCLLYAMYNGNVYFPKAVYDGTTINESARYFTISRGEGTVSCSNGYLSGSANPSACIPTYILGARA